MPTIHFITADHTLKAKTFIELANQVWPGDYNLLFTQQALEKTINITAWDQEKLVGCLRLLTDGYYFGTITEILVLPDYQRRGIGRTLMAIAAEITPTTLYWGAQPDAVSFYEDLGYEKSLQSFVIRKERKQ